MTPLTGCCMPDYHLPVVATNRAGQPVGREHVAVVVAAWAAGRNEEGVSDQ